MDKNGNLYLTGLTQNAVTRRTLDGKIQSVVSDPRL
jgi:sugar lactone lactonase YvrE